MACQDPFVKLIREKYKALPLRTPDPRFVPYTVLKRSHENRGSFTYIGNLKGIVDQTTLPEIIDSPVADLQGRTSSSLDVSAGLDIAVDLLAIKEQLADLKTAFKAANNISFQFDNVKLSYIDQIELGKALRNVKVDQRNPVLHVEYLWIITEAYTSDKFTINSDSSSAVSFAADIPLPGHVTGAPVTVTPKIGVKATGEKHENLTFDLPLRQTFAFKCLRLKIEKDGTISDVKNVRDDSKDLVEDAVSADHWSVSVTTLAPKKLALFIGINKYQHVNPLNGAVNDIDLAEDTLKKAGFETFIRLCGDGSSNPQPSRTAIISAFDDIIEEVKKNPGGIVAIHYSGHGSTAPNANKPTGQNETIVPYDSGRDPILSTDIIDDDIRVKLQQIASYAAHVVVVFDSCHSESITRDISSPVPSGARIVPPNKQIDRSQTDLKKTPEHYYRPAMENVVVIAACSYDKLAREMSLGSEGKVYGALSYHWYTALATLLNSSNNMLLTYGDLFDQIYTSFKKLEYDQEPNIEGDKTWGLFGASKLYTQSFANVIQQKSDYIQLNVGAAHGVTAESTFLIYPNTVRIVDGTPTTTAVVKTVDSTTLWAKVDPIPTIDLKGYRAFEVTRAPSKLLSIHLPANFPQNSTKIIQSYYELLSEAEAKLKVREISPGENSHFNVEKPSYIVMDQHNNIVLPLETITDVTNDIWEQPVLAHNLVEYARYQLHLNNNNASSLHDHIEFRIQTADEELFLQKEPDEWAWKDFIDGDYMPEGKYIRFAVKQTSSPEKQLYFAILGFDEKCEIAQFYPLNGAAAEPLKNGERFMVPLHKAYGPLSLDTTVPRPANVPIRAYFKIYVSTEPTHFTYLEQEGFSRTRVFSKTPVSRGAVTDWTCKTISYVIQRK